MESSSRVSDADILKATKKKERAARRQAALDAEAQALIDEAAGKEVCAHRYKL